MDAGYKMSAADTFEIVDCPVTYSMTASKTFEISQPKITPWPQYATGADGDPAKFGIYGIGLDSTEFFGFSGQHFVMASKYSRFAAHHHGFTGGIADFGGFVSDETQLLKTHYENGTYPGFHMNRGVTPGNSRAIECDCDLYLSNMTIRGPVAINYQGRLIASMIAMQQLELYDGAYAYIDWLYLGPQGGGAAGDGVVCKDSSFRLSTVYATTLTGDLFNLYRSKASIEYIEGVSPTQYGLHITAISSVELVNSQVNGTAGQVRFDFGPSTVAYPAAGNSATDNGGSFVTKL
jgi:hypothetical protein